MANNFGRGGKGKDELDLESQFASAAVHAKDDVDTQPRAHHHTLGNGINQAAPGKSTNDQLVNLTSRMISVELANTSEEADLFAHDGRITALEDPARTWSANPNATQTIAANTVTDVAGMTVNVPVRGVNDLFLVIMSWDVQANAAVGAGIFAGRLNADGAFIAVEAIYQPQVNNARTTVTTAHFVTGLAAGARTFKGQMRDAQPIAGSQFSVFGSSEMRIVRMN